MFFSTSAPSRRQWFYGGGIQVAPAGCTQAGRPVQVIEMGFTQIPLDLFNEFLREISPNFTPAKYSLLKWNCNNFSDEVCKFLLGKPIPAHITGLPAEVGAVPVCVESGRSLAGREPDTPIPDPDS